MSEQNRVGSYCRVIRLKQDPSKVDEAIKLWTKEILPKLKKQKGFAGASLVGSRRSGNGMTVSYWETETAMKQAREHMRAEVTRVMEKSGGRIVEDEECEVALLERFQSPKSGVWSRITTIQGDPAQADKAIANFRETVVPSIKKQSGARTALFFVNRQNGKTIAGSVWDTEQDLQRSEAPIGELRSAAVKQFGGHDPKTEVFEIFHTEILALASVR